MKKVIPFVAAATAITVATTAPTYAATPFTDMKNYDETTQQAVTYLVNEGIVKGTSATTFTPAREITRGQVVKMLGRYIESTGVKVPTNWETVQRFNDVPVTVSDKELLKYAALVFDEGVFVGSNGNLNAAGKLTRENLALVLLRLAKDANLAQYVKDQGLQSNVKDIAAVKAEAKQAVELFNALGISNVDIFNPKGDVKRVHFASFLAKLLQTVEKIEEEQQKPGEGETPKPGEGETPEPGEGETPEPGEGETPEPGEGEAPKPGEGEAPEPDEGETPEPGEGETPEPGEGEAPEPDEGETPEPDEGETPEPDEGETPEPGEGETPEPGEGETPEPGEEGYTFDYAELKNVTIETSTANKVIINDTTHGKVELSVNPTLARIFNESDMLRGAIVSIDVDEDSIVALHALEVMNAGTAAQPITIDGADFTNYIPITIRSQYANVMNFKDYHEELVIEAPANASYTFGVGDFDRITSTGAISLTFTAAVESEINLHAPNASITVARNGFVTGLISSENVSITVQEGGHFQDLHLLSTVDTLTVNGDIANVNADTTGAITLNGTGTIYRLAGKATTVNVSENGVTVEELAVDPSVESVTVR